MLCRICIRCKQIFVIFATLVIIPTSLCRSEYVSEIRGSTDIKISKLKFTWTITNYNFSSQNVGDIIKSPAFSANDGCKWYLDIRPKGANNETKDYVALYLFSINCNTSVEAKLGILNSKGDQTYIRKLSYYYTPGKSLGYKKYILETYLSNPENDFLPDNKLTIVCEITATEGRENSLREFAQPKRHLLEDFKHLLENQVLTDVTLTTQGKGFNVHKAILAARSPAFKVRFENDAENVNNSLVEISHLDPTTLAEILRYIYTEEVFNLEKVAPKLLTAAEDFGLDGLKTLCENSLRLNLSIKNAVYFFTLGDKNTAGKLKQDAKEFIIAHASSISHTPEFNSLIFTQPQLAVEIINLLG